MVAIVYQTDKRSGITYAYESISLWDKEKQQSRVKRRLIGRVDKITGEIVPTDGRNRKKRDASLSEEQAPKCTAVASRSFFGQNICLMRLVRNQVLQMTWNIVFLIYISRFCPFHTTLSSKIVLLYTGLTNGAFSVSIRMEKIPVPRGPVKFFCHNRRK